MICLNRKAAALAFALCGASLLAAPAGAQSLFNSSPAPAAEQAAEAVAGAATRAAKPARKTVAKKVAAKNASKVNVINKRGATLVELTLVSKSAANAQPQVVASGLLAGKRKTANLAKNGGCIYDIAGEFDDESTIEVAGLDLCRDGNINLVE